jgi:ATP-binding protein involved in chromosome partitioning
MSITEAQVQSALKELIDPNTGKDFITTRSARNIRIDDTDVAVDIELGYPAKSQMDHLRG